MANYPLPVKGVAYILYVGLTDQSNTKLLKASPTIASGDFKVSIDGGAFANLSTLPTVTPSGGTSVKISLSSGEMNGDNIAVRCIDAAGAEWCDLPIDIQTASKGIDDIAATAGNVAGITGVTIPSTIPSLAQMQAGLPTNASIASAVMTDVSDTIGADVVLIKSKTDNLPASPAAVGSAMTLTSGERDAIANDLLDLSAGVETSLTLRQALRVIFAAAGGKLTGATTTTIKIRNFGDTKDRISATVDTDGNRNSISYDLT